MPETPETQGGTSPLVLLAHDAIVAYVTEGRVLDVPNALPAALRQRAASFVSLKKSGALRGCIGTLEPAHSSLAEEIIHNAVSAASRDPRFPPVTRGEIRDLTISVDVLSAAEPVSALSDFDPARHGMIVRAGLRRGVLLPDLEGVDTPDRQFSIVCRKAGITLGEPVELFRFTVARHH